MIDLLVGYFLKYNNISNDKINISGNIRLIFYAILIYELIQSFLFPSISNLSLFLIFHDNIFVSRIAALNHVGSAIAGLFGFILSYMKLTKWLYKTPFISTIFIYIHIIVYDLYSQSNNKIFHAIWHLTYHILCSIMNISLVNLLVLSIKTGDKGPYFIIYNILMKIGHILGPLIHLLMNCLFKWPNFEKFHGLLNCYNINYTNAFITVLSLLKLYVTMGLDDPNRDYALVPKDSQYSIDDKVEMKYVYDSKRYSRVPIVIFLTNVFVTIGAGISIRFMDIYLLKKFNVDYTFFWLASLLIPILTSLILLVMNSKQKLYGKMSVVFVSYFISLIFLYIFIYNNDKKTVLVAYILRSVFQNAPSPIKTSMIIQCSKISSAGYWLSADYITRIVFAITGLIGGIIVESYGYQACFLITGLIYTTTTMILLPCSFIYSEL